MSDRPSPSPVPIDEELWRARYPADVAREVDVDVFPSLVDMLAASTTRHAQRTAYVSLGARMSYAELDRASRDFAAYLRGPLGVRPGDRVALVLPNVMAFPAALFGTLRAGAVAVSTNPLYTAPEMRHQLADSGAVAVVVLENMAATLARALEGTAVRATVVARVGDLLGARGRLVNFVVRHVKRLVPPYRIDGEIPFAAALRAGRDLALAPVRLGPEDLALLQYTGGTTGRAKGAMLSHRNLVANTEQCRAWFAPALGEQHHTMVTALPLYHVFAFTVNCLLMVRCGATSLLVLDPRDLRGFVRELGRHPFTLMTGVNTLFAHLLDTPGFSELDFSRLRLSIAGGMAAQRPVAERWRRITGRPLIEGYGLTEASPVTACNRLDIEDFTGAIGLPLPSTEVQVRDPGGRALGVDEVGELYFRGPQVMRGYWGQEQETAAVLGDDGFLATGDIGMVGEDGLVRVVDRAKDAIVVSGFKVYPTEVEEAAAGCPGVREVGVVGLPDADTGEAVAMFVVRSDPGLTEQALLAHLGASLARYKIPRRIEFRDELPKTPVGKVLRRELREEVSA